MRNYLKDLCSPPTSTSPRPAVLQGGGEEKYDNGQSSLTVVNHHFLAKYNHLFYFRSKYPVFFWLYMIVLLLNLWFIFFKANCSGWFPLLADVLLQWVILSYLLNLSKWFNKKPELVEHELKIKMDYFLFLLVFIVIPVYLLIYIDKTPCGSSFYSSIPLLICGLVCIIIIIYYVLQFIFMDKTEEKRVTFWVRVYLTICIVFILLILHKVISPAVDLNMLYYSYFHLEPMTMLHLKSPQHILDTLIPAGPARPQDIDPELVTMSWADINASGAPGRFVRELRNIDWAEISHVYNYSPNDIQTTSTFNPNGRGTVIHNIYPSSPSQQEFVRYSFTPGIWSTNIRTR
jgi:hypothetical protein